MYEERPKGTGGGRNSRRLSERIVLRVFLVCVVLRGPSRSTLPCGRQPVLWIYFMSTSHPTPVYASSTLMKVRPVIEKLVEERAKMQASSPPPVEKPDDWRKRSR